MSDFLKKYFCEANNEFPAGIRLLINAVGIALMFLATSLLAPSINESFELEKRKSAFYQTYFESFNSDSKDFYSKLAVYVADSDSGVMDQNQYKELRELISKMQMRIVELFLLMPEGKSTAAFTEYQTSLNALIPYLENARTSKLEDRESLRRKLDVFLRQTATVIIILAEKANIVSSSADQKGP